MKNRKNVKEKNTEIWIFTNLFVNIDRWQKYVIFCTPNFFFIWTKKIVFKFEINVCSIFIEPFVAIWEAQKCIQKSSNQNRENEQIMNKYRSAFEYLKL